jgi:hypothetical protein
MVTTSPSRMRMNSRGGRRAQIFRFALRFHDPRGIIVISAVTLHEDRKLLVRLLLAFVPQLPAAEPFGQRQANRAFRFLHQKAGKTEMIEMRVGEGEILQRTTAQQSLPKLVPDFKDVVGVHAAVDQRPARAVVEQPAIDVVGRVWHRQPHPEQAGQEVRQFAKGRRALHREFQIIGHCCPLLCSLRDFVKSSTPKRFSCLPCGLDSKNLPPGP